MMKEQEIILMNKIIKKLSTFKEKYNLSYLSYVLSGDVRKDVGETEGEYHFAVLEFKITYTKIGGKNSGTIRIDTTLNNLKLLHIGLDKFFKELE